MKRLLCREYLTLEPVSLVIFPDDQLLPVQDIICWTDLSGPNNILRHRSQSDQRAGPGRMDRSVPRVR